MTELIGLLLAFVCFAIEAIALGLAVAAWGTPAPAGLRLARGTAVTVGIACIVLAAIHPASTLIYH